MCGGDSRSEGRARVRVGWSLREGVLERRVHGALVLKIKTLEGYRGGV